MSKHYRRDFLLSALDVSVGFLFCGSTARCTDSNDISAYNNKLDRELFYSHIAFSRYDISIDMDLWTEWIEGKNQCSNWYTHVWAILIIQMAKLSHSSSFIAILVTKGRNFEEYFSPLVWLSRSSQIITQTFKPRFPKSSDADVYEDGLECRVGGAVCCVRIVHNDELLCTW